MKVWDTPSGYSPYEYTELARIAEQPHWVYEIYSPGGACLYVGMTADLRRRTREHKRRFGKDIEVRATEVADRLAAEGLEVARIRELEPSANRLRYSGDGEPGPTRYLGYLPCCSTPRVVTSQAALLNATAVHVCPTEAVE